MGGYRVPEWKQSIRQNLFRVEVDGQSFELVKAEYMTGDQVQALQVATSGDPAALYAFIDELCPGLGSALRPIPMKFLNEFVQAWQSDSGMELGESSGSTASSESTEKPLSTISSPTAID